MTKTHDIHDVEEELRAAGYRLRWTWSGTDVRVATDITGIGNLNGDLVEDFEAGRLTLDGLLDRLVNRAA